MAKRKTKKSKGNLLGAFVVGFFILSFISNCSDRSDSKNVNKDIEPSSETNVLEENNNENNEEISNIISNSKEQVSRIINNENSEFVIEFVDVGQGDCILISCDNHYAIVDGGNASNSDLLYSKLTTYNVKNIDYIFASHPDADHIGGLPGVLNYCIKNNINVKGVYCNDKNDTPEYIDFVKYTNKLGKDVEEVYDGQIFNMGKVKFEVLACDVSSDNNDSIVLMTSYGNNRVLLTGDAETETENYLNENKNIKADILKVAHHGSKYSTGYLFIKNVDPIYAIISVGGNLYGHPTEEVLSKLEDADIKTYRTDYNGDIRCSSDGDIIACEVEKNAEKCDDNGKQNSTSSGITRSMPIVSNNEYCLNKNSMKFHYATCSSVSKMSDSNKEFTNASRDEIIAMGYTPCQKCKP